MFQENIPLARHSNYRIGGPARFFLTVKTAKELEAATKEARIRNLPVFILGGGTNLLIDDRGFPGLVLKAGFDITDYHNKDNYLIRVGAGVDMADLLEFTVEQSLTGLEWAGGLPGTVGGATWGNAGAFGGEMKDKITEVISMDIHANTVTEIHRTNVECKFKYRSSIFKEKALNGKPEVITEVILRLAKGDKKAIQEGIEEKIVYRQARQPLDYPNIGSIFKNIDTKLVPKEVLAKFKHKIKKDPFPVLPTAVLIDAAGLKGVSIGGAMISQKHPNFIVNHLGASSNDVKQLMGLIKSEVKSKFGVDLEQEAIFV